MDDRDVGGEEKKLRFYRNLKVTNALHTHDEANNKYKTCRICLFFPNNNAGKNMWEEMTRQENIIKYNINACQTFIVRNDIKKTIVSNGSSI